jgi:hypothetical protein
MRWAGYVTRFCERKFAYRVLVEKPEGKRRLGRHKRKWEDNIRIDVYDCGRGRTHIGFWWGNLREREDLVDISVNGRIMLE